MLTDSEKIYALAKILKDEIYETKLSFAYIPAWGKKFKFNEAGEIIKIQVDTKGGYFKTIAVDPDYEQKEKDISAQALEDAE